jgi:predicted nucleic acid-binding protein
MKYLWDSNVLRHYLDDHPLLLENLKKVNRQDVLLPVVVVAEQFRGRMDALVKAEPSYLIRAQQHFQKTQRVLSKFQILYFDEKSLGLVSQLTERFKTRKRYADVLIAAQALASRCILVTRNTADFRDFLPPQQLQNWVDEPIS